MKKEKRKPGRPPVGETTLGKTFQVQFVPDIEKRLIDYAAKFDMSHSGAIRMFVERGLEKK